MKLKNNILEKTIRHIEKQKLDTSPEELFVSFEEIYQLHCEFEIYLKDKKYNKNLEKMQRNKRLLEKRKLFVEWYFFKTQNDLSVKEAFINLSEMIFASTKTVQNDLSKETTA